ncbi:hypothetical protein WR25_14672 isoform A [Diploscapter pachys]|uniref:Kinesin-like protein n=1 Tax=Diploscapter pachys TaxID=2018661 RepID=A0A2A2KAF0_9BILA|nr:hypothetical protein WR25_14672 isoform A [Diploscapter pachys]
MLAEAGEYSKDGNMSKIGNETTKKKGGKSEETPRNIVVAARIRPMNDSEKASGAMSICRADTINRAIILKNKSLTPFDRVYGPTASQKEIFDDLVKPSVQRAVRGYNCTIFAYGQTGTGKTYTMEGGNTSKEILSAAADPTTGLIPRAVEEIFTEINNLGTTEYTVRVSYVELYNEELTDLLAPNTPYVPDKKRLRIYEDENHKGSVVVQGLEQVAVTHRHDVFNLLKAGTEKRRTAATLMNASSSRSHTVFSVTITMKETNEIGDEEMLKVGKLNLVDLAGSESIGRSGAVGKTAKEAGLINQSLLTLGRVITALTVSSGQHIPYRESKLTRLLQDALGGSSITSLIATVSPASCNLEETASTLDYALRARNIVNKPTVNERVLGKVVLNSLAGEIDQLRKDLKAAHERNGIYLSKETYDRYETESQRAAELDEVCQKISRQLQQMADDLTLTDNSYFPLYKRAVQLEQRLQDRNEEISQLKMKEAEQQTKLQAYENTLIHVDLIANDLKKKLDEAVQVGQEQQLDLQDLKTKYDAMWKLANANKNAVTQARASITDSASAAIAALHQIREQFTTASTAQTQQFETTIDLIKTLLATQLGKTQTATREMQKTTEMELETQRKEAEQRLAEHEQRRQDANSQLESLRNSMEAVLKKTDASAQTVKDIIGQVTGQLEGFGKELQAARTEGIDVAMQAKERAEEETQKRLEQYRQSMNKLRAAAQLILTETAVMEKDEQEWQEAQVLEAQTTFEKATEVWQRTEDICRGHEDEVGESLGEIGRQTEQSRQEWKQMDGQAEEAVKQVKQTTDNIVQTVKLQMESDQKRSTAFGTAMKEKCGELEVQMEECKQNGDRHLEALLEQNNQHNTSQADNVASLYAKSEETCQQQTETVNTLVDSKWQHPTVTGQANHILQ